MNLNVESDIEAMARAPRSFSDHTNKHVTDASAAQAFMNYVFGRIASGNYPSCNTWLNHNGNFFDVSLEGFAQDYGQDIGMKEGDKHSTGGIWMGFSGSPSAVTVNHFGPFGINTASQGDHMSCRGTSCTVASSDTIRANRLKC